MARFNFDHEDLSADATTFVRNGVTVATEGLTDVLKAFHEFLIASGFTYIDEVTAFSDNFVYSSKHAHVINYGEE